MFLPLTIHQQVLTSCPSHPNIHLQSTRNPNKAKRTKHPSEDFFEPRAQQPPPPPIPECKVWLCSVPSAEDRRINHLPEGTTVYLLPDWGPRLGCPPCRSTPPSWSGHPGRQCPSRSPPAHFSAGVAGVLWWGQSWGG